MPTPCEIVIKKFLPVMRIRIAKELVNNYSFTQIQVASVLGITQAAVSKYLAGCYGADLKSLEKNRRIRRMGERIAALIAMGGIDEPELVNSVCRSCEKFFMVECKIRG